MMNRFFLIFFFICSLYSSLYIIYGVNSNVVFMSLVRHFIYTPDDLDKPVLRKDIKRLSDINGIYHFSCKYPDLYSIGLGYKYEYIPTAFLLPDRNPAPKGGYNLKFQTIIKNNLGQIVYSNISNEIIAGYGQDLYHYSEHVFDKFVLENCKDLTLEIRFIDSNLPKEIPEDLIYVYIRIDTTH